MLTSFTWESVPDLPSPDFFTNFCVESYKPFIVKVFSTFSTLSLLFMRSPFIKMLLYNFFQYCYCSKLSNLLLLDRRNVTPKRHHLLYHRWLLHNFTLTMLCFMWISVIIYIFSDNYFESKSKISNFDNFYFSDFLSFSWFVPLESKIHFIVSKCNGFSK